MNSSKKNNPLKSSCAFVLATFFGAGLFPKAPGTMGTLVAIPLAYLTANLPLTVRIAFWLFLALAGIWAAKTLQDDTGIKDNQKIVIDEVVGLGITAWTAGTDWRTLTAAFILFRILDIIKLPPVRQADHWSKNHDSSLVGGTGVMADDVLAGFQGLLVILLMQHFGFLN